MLASRATDSIVASSAPTSASRHIRHADNDVPLGRRPGRIRTDNRHQPDVAVGEPEDRSDRDAAARWQYWRWDYTSNGESVDFTLVQFFVGDACRDQFGDSDDACASDNNARFRSHRISADEFTRVVAGRAPAADAPADYSYADYGVVVTVENGLAVAAEQLFTS
jgi:hypothetical protein